MCGLHIAVGKLRLIASVHVQLVFFLKNNSCILFFSILIREKNICLKNRKEKIENKKTIFTPLGQVPSLLVS